MTIVNTRRQALPKILVRSCSNAQPAPSPEQPATTGWVRLPTRGFIPGTGITRGAAYELIRQGRIRTASLPVHGKKRGIRLIWLPSLMALIEANVQEVS